MARLWLNSMWFSTIYPTYLKKYDPWGKSVPSIEAQRVLTTWLNQRWAPCPNLWVPLFTLHPIRGKSVWFVKENGYHLVMTNIRKITMLLIGKPSISMGHGSTMAMLVITRGYWKWGGCWSVGIRSAQEIQSPGDPVLQELRPNKSGQNPSAVLSEIATSFPDFWGRFNWYQDREGLNWYLHLSPENLMDVINAVTLKLLKCFLDVVQDIQCTSRIHSCHLPLEKIHHSRRFWCYLWWLQQPLIW
jgi:hypothetical protein